MNTNYAINPLIILLLILGVGAIFGGTVLIVSPSGELLGIPLSILNESPFANFFITGIILLTVLGILPTALAIALIKKPIYKFAELFNLFKDMYWAWTFSIYVAFALIIWIHMQIYFIKATHWLHTIYVLLGISILFVALLPKVRNRYKKLD